MSDGGEVVYAQFPVLVIVHEDGTLMLPEQRLRFNSLLPERGVIYDLTARRHRKD